jgi:hypothetical protein
MISEAFRILLYPCSVLLCLHADASCCDGMGLIWDTAYPDRVVMVTLSAIRKLGLQYLGETRSPFFQVFSNSSFTNQPTIFFFAVHSKTLTTS